MTPTGTTRVAGVIGDPVRHSLSPVIHNAAFAATGLDWVYVAFPVPAGQGEAAMSAMRVLGIDGLSVTMPHKEAAAQACDELTPAAAALASVNTVVRRDGRLLGDSTDGEGFLRSLSDAGVEVGGVVVAVLGAGGAARAVAASLAGAGAEVRLSARRDDAASEAAGRAGVAAAPWASVDELVAGSALVVNATPLGMGGEDPPFTLAALRADHVVADLVYVPEGTPLLAAARSAGATTVGGLGMLVHQAALAFEAWTGEAAPIAVMADAARAALASR